MKIFFAWFKNHSRATDSDTAQVLFLFLISLIAHGLFIPWLGFYGDDWSLLWLSYKADTVVLFFPGNRFLLTYIYTFLSRLLPANPIFWHIFFFFMSFLSVINFRKVLKYVWPSSEHMWIWVSLLLLLYPGSLIFYQPVTYCVVFLQFNLLFASFWLMFKAANGDQYRTAFSFLSVLFSLLNLVLSEYLFFLELLRIPLLFIFLEQNENPSFKQSIRKVMGKSWPYLLVFSLLSIIRLLSQGEYSSLYRFDVNAYLSNPIQTILYFMGRFVTDGFKSGMTTWVKPVFDPLLYKNSGVSTIIIFSIITFLTLLLIFGFNVLMPAKKGQNKISQQAMMLGIIGLFLGGVPFWLGDRYIDIGVGIFSRFSIPAAIGSAFLLFGLVNFLIRNRILNITALSILCGISVMMYLLTGNLFRKEWEFQNRYFWEMAWRMPALAPGTTILTNEPPIWMVTENTLSAAINWIYMQQEPPVEFIDYYLYYDMDKFQAEVPDEKDTNFIRGHMSGVFSGNSSNILVMHHQLPACLAVVNARWDRYNPDIPLHLRETALQHPDELILPQGAAESSLAGSPVFLDETRKNFCYFFQKGSLAVQQEDWSTAVSLWQETQQRGFRPNHAAERIPFMQAFARTGQYEPAFALSLKMIEISKSYRPMVCAFWQEMLAEGGLDIARVNWHMQNELTCEIASLP